MSRKIEMRPFKHATAMMALIAAAMESTNPTLAMSNIPAYASRGHGRNKPFVKSWLSHTNQRRLGVNRKPPMNGARECARRALQIGGA